MSVAAPLLCGRHVARVYMSHDVIGVALRMDVSRHEDTPTQRRDALPVELPRNDSLERSHHRVRRRYLGVVA